jgi:hypothetical protein
MKMSTPSLIGSTVVLCHQLPLMEECNDSDQSVESDVSDGRFDTNAQHRHHHQRSMNRHNDDTRWRRSSESMLGRSLHSALPRTNRIPYRFDDFGMRSPTTTNRRSILRKRFQRTTAISVEVTSTESGGGDRTLSDHQAMEGNSNHRRRRRLIEVSSTRNRHRTVSDLHVHSGSGDSCEGKQGSNSEVDDIDCSLGSEADEDEECGSCHSSTGRRFQSPLRRRVCLTPPRNGSFEYHQCKNHHEVQHRNQAWCDYGHNAASNIQKFVTTPLSRRRQIIYTMLIAVTIAALYMYFEFHSNIVHHERLTTLLPGKKAIVQQLNFMQRQGQGIIDGVDTMYLDAPIGRQGGAREGGSTEKEEERMIEGLSIRVESLQRTLQRLARQRLAEDFSLTFPQDSKNSSNNLSRFVEVRLDLKGLPNPLVIQLAGSIMPCTSWTFLSQLHDGNWALKGNHQGFKIVSVGSTKVNDISIVDKISEADVPLKLGSIDSNKAHVSVSENGDPEGQQIDGSKSYRLDFLEDSAIEVDRRFVLGIRNPQKGGLPVVLIYRKRGMCGKMQGEVCFGKVTEGFDSLNLIDKMIKDEVTYIQTISVRQSEPIVDTSTGTI